jgi:hypothetical protein
MKLHGSGPVLVSNAGPFFGKANVFVSHRISWGSTVRSQRAYLHFRSWLFLEIDVSDLLAAAIAHYKANFLLFDYPGWWEAAGFEHEPHDLCLMPFI